MRVPARHSALSSEHIIKRHILLKIRASSPHKRVGRSGRRPQVVWHGKTLIHVDVDASLAGNDAGLFEPHLHDVPHFPFSTFRPPLGSLQDAPLEGMSDPTDPDVHPIKAGAPPSAHCALQSYTDETYNVACPASFLDSSIRGMAQFHDPDALNAYFFQSMQGFGALR